MKLTFSELKVMELRAVHLSFRQIAELRGCALSTACNLASSATRKLGLHGTKNTQAIRRALLCEGQQMADEQQIVLTMEDF